MSPRFSKLRLVVIAVLTGMLVASLTALAGLAAPPPGKGKKKGGAVSVSQYQYGPGGKQYGKNMVAVCHKGKTIRIAQPAVKAHLRHGDRLGSC